MKAFFEGFEKSASAAGTLGGAALNAGLGAGIGALGGGEKDEHGKTKNRSIGAGRGAAALGASSAVGGTAAHLLMPHQLKLLEKGRAGRAIGLGGAGALAGLAAGVGAYKAMKHFGPKYDKEKAKAT